MFGFAISSSTPSVVSTTEGFAALAIANAAYFDQQRIALLVEALEEEWASQVRKYLEKKLSAGDTRAFEKACHFLCSSSEELDELYDQLHLARDNWVSMQ